MKYEISFSVYLSPVKNACSRNYFIVIPDKGLFGQNSYRFDVISGDQPAAFFHKKLVYKDKVHDMAQAKAEAKSLLEKLHDFGYVAASVDSLVSDTLKTTAYIYVGEKFDKVIIGNGNVNEKILNDAGLKNVVLKEQTVPITQVPIIKSNILHVCENGGYPFASVKLDSFEQDGNTIYAKIYLERNELIRFDTMRLIGKTRVKKMFLKNYLGIKPGKPYNESTIAKITQRLRELQFAEVVQASTVSFQSGKAIPNIYLKDKRASQFDILVGLLPGSSGQKLLITGDVTLHLFSPFGVGEEFYLQWQKLQPKTQTLNVKLVYPYLIGLPLGINASFNLYKHDTSYVDINGDYGIQYQIIGNSYLKASLKQKITIMTTVDTAYIIANHTLPQNIDLSTNEFALEYYLQKLDYRFNPTSGYTLTIGGSAGVRTIKRNTNILGLYDEQNGKFFSYLYDTTQLHSFEFRVALNIDKFWRLAPRHTIRTMFDGKYYYNQHVYENEKYRLGGLNSLRGFDDQSIFTPFYGMGDIEYRFLLSKNSYFSSFFNAALVQNSLNPKTIDIPFGFGVGAAIETKAGIFGITYAMGEQQGNSLSIKSAKIHFGYVNYF